MNERIKNYLHLAIIVGVVFVGVAAVSASFAYRASIRPDSYRSFSVNAEGKITAVPDIAFFTFGVLTEGGTEIAKLQQENTEKANKAIAFLKSLKIAEKDIKTENYNVSPRYEYPNCPPIFDRQSVCPPPRIAGYAISQNVSVKIRDFAVIGAALGGVVEQGANTVSGISFQIDDPIAFQNEAREEAIKRAKEKAKSIARAGGFRVGRLLTIDEGGPIYPFFRAEALALDAKGGELPPLPTILPGSQEISVNVTLRYEIK
jgi:uncharacterized protein YggE